MQQRHQIGPALAFQALFGPGGSIVQLGPGNNATTCALRSIESSDWAGNVASSGVRALSGVCFRIS